MFRPILAGTALTLIAGSVWAQPYPPPPPPVVAGPPAVVVTPPPVGTTTVAPAPESPYRSTTVTHGVDAFGNTVTKKKTYREGVAGSSVTRRVTRTDPFSGTTTTHTSTTNNP